MNMKKHQLQIIDSEIIKTPDMASIHRFLKLDKMNQADLLMTKGLLLDTDIEKESFTNLYLFEGFFVEEVVSRINGEVLEVIPYKQGYRLNKFIELKTVAVLRSSRIFHSTILN